MDKSEKKPMKKQTKNILIAICFLIFIAVMVFIIMFSSLQLLDNSKKVQVPQAVETGVRENPISSKLPAVTSASQIDKSNQSETAMYSNEQTVAPVTENVPSQSVGNQSAPAPVAKPAKTSSTSVEKKIDNVISSIGNKIDSVIDSVTGDNSQSNNENTQDNNNNNNNTTNNSNNDASNSIATESNTQGGNSSQSQSNAGNSNNENSASENSNNGANTNTSSSNQENGNSSDASNTGNSNNTDTSGQVNDSNSNSKSNVQAVQKTIVSKINEIKSNI